MKYLLAAAILLCVLTVRSQSQAERFLTGLDSIRKELKIPALSAAAKKGDALIFDTAFGFADVERKIRATKSTVFRVASVTKTFTSTLIMQQVEKGKLRLDQPISDFGVDLGNPGITVRQLLTHTSEGIPGTGFQYNGYRYGRLGTIIEQASGIPFYQLLMENIVMPLKMTSSAPGIPLDQYFGYRLRNKSVEPYFSSAFTRLARPYELNSKGMVVPTEYYNEFGAFGGLATTAEDLLKYADAIGRSQFVTAATQQQIFTPNRTRDSVITPYGLGWFVQEYEGLRFCWHYGQTQGESALLLLIPELRLSLAVLCNTDKLSQPFQLGDGDLMASPVGQLFYRIYIHPAPITDQGLKNKEMIARATMALLNGDTLRARQIYDQYGRQNFKQPSVDSGKVIASIRDAGVNVNISKPFALTETTEVSVAGVGENCSPDLSSWCDYGWIEDHSGKIIWQMQAQPAEPAGGAAKNKKVVRTFSLPAGEYTLHFKSDGGHAYGSWDSLPPDNFFWGIVVSAASGSKR